MKHFPCVQGEIDWSEYRRGIPTASSFDKIITPGGKDSGSREKYKFRLLAERMGAEIADVKTWSMQRGSILEERAVDHYDWVRGVESEACGFFADDSVRWGASPDRTVGDDGLLECKCPDLETHMMYLMAEGTAYKDYKVQCQGQLWVTGRQWVDVLSYSPGLPWALQRIGRDDAFIEKMDKAVRAFSDDLEALCAEAENKRWLKPRDAAGAAIRPQPQTLVDALRDSLAEMNRK